MSLVGTTPPARAARSARAQEIVDAARVVLEQDGPEALTMRRLAAELGIRAPSLYKHLPDKAAVEHALVEEGLAEFGSALHAAVADPERRGAIADLLATYRRLGTSQPHLYRLATVGPLDRDALPPGLEDWAGAPFLLVTGDPHRAQALWSFAHGMVGLEIDGRYPAGSDLDRTWRAGAEAFARASRPA